MKKSVRYLLLSAIGIANCAGLAACGGSNGDGLKIGMVCIGDTKTSTYDKNFRMGLDDAAKELGIDANQVYYYEAKGEGDTAKQAAQDAAEDGCDIVILNSYGHQYFADAVAKKII